MPYLLSAPPDITEGIPFALSSREVASSFVRTGYFPDISINDMPFLLACSEQNAYVRETAESSKQQIDTSAEPGEQTLSQWWTRSQDSWHGGAGVTWYEPGSVEETKYRYFESYGIDPWDQGEVKLLKKMVAGRASTTTNRMYVVSALVGGVDCVFYTVDGVLYKHNGTTETAYTVSSGGTPTGSVVIAGQNVLVGTTTGISLGALSGTALTSLWTIASGTTISLWWAKNRIIASRDASIWELTLAGGSMGSALYTHPSATWTWESATEAPDSILITGRDNGLSSIFSMALIDSGTAGSTPTLGAMVQVAEMPPGEEIRSLQAYIGAYIGVGTSKGVRVGILGDGGTVTLGPLTIETTYPVKAIAARDRFIYASIRGDIDGNSGCARIDLSVETDNGRFAWAYDADVGAAAYDVDDLSFLGGSSRVVIGQNHTGIFMQSATVYVDEGYIQSGRVRFATSEPKEFALARMRGTTPTGTSIELYTVFPDSDPVYNFSLGPGIDDNVDISIRSSDYSLQYLSLGFRLLSDTSAHTSTPVLDATSLKALPRTRVQRLIQIPLMCFDHERDRRGIMVGYNGSAWARLEALEELESARAMVSVHDWTSGEEFTATIKSISFSRVKPPERESKNYGGIILATFLVI
jgi:hypothetical protein